MTADHGAAPAPRRRRKSTALAPLPAGPEHVGLICGLPTSLTYLAADFARDLIQRAYGSCEVIPFNSMSDETVRRLAGARIEPKLLLSEVPDDSIVRYATAERFPVVVVDQGFAEACRDFISARDLALLDAARSISRAQIGSIAISAIERAIIIRPELDAPAGQLAQKIAAVLGVAHDALTAMIRDRALVRPLEALLYEHFSHGAFVGDDRDEGTLAQLDLIYSLSMTDQQECFNLPVAVLVDGRPPHLPMTGPIELVGPARCLTFGPYFNFPAGHWEASIEFFTDGNVPANSFRIDLLADREAKVDHQFQIEGGGSYRLTFDFEIQDQYQPIEIRTFICSGAISGRFCLTSLSLGPKTKP